MELASYPDITVISYVPTFVSNYTSLNWYYGFSPSYVSEKDRETLCPLQVFSIIYKSGGSALLRDEFLPEAVCSRWWS